MSRISPVLAALVIMISPGIVAAGALENRLDSLGPLKRYDPNAPSTEFLVKVHGNPRKGLPEGAGEQVQRLSDKVWYLETNQRIAKMEPNYVTGEVMLQGILEAHAEWAVSPDEKLMFACRKTERHLFVGECFDLATGESKWTFEKGMEIMDVCFTPDGSQAVILHALPKAPGAPPAIKFDPSAPPDFDTIRKMIPPALAAVSWYDANSGEMIRRVNVPGTGSGSFGRGVSRLAFSGDQLYVARPTRDTPNECLVIKAGATEPEKVEVGAVSEAEEPQVRVGGTRGEFIVFHSNNHVVLFQQKENGKLTQLKELELPRTREGNAYTWCSRFTPDGNRLVLSSRVQTIHLATHDTAKVQRAEFPGGSALADFSEDGSYFVTFDDGGGWVRKASSWEMVRAFESKLRPPHCCPITEAGFSISGNYIISNDDRRLLLWSKDGQQLAELYSARCDANEPVRMQSPVIVEEMGQIYAADGYDFLVWDLKALNVRLARKPDNVPRLKGEVVFRDRQQENGSPELMTIRVDSKGEQIITATRNVVHYRPLAKSDPVRVAVSDDIYLNPRIFMPGAKPSSVIVRAGVDAYSLDLTGREKAELLGQGVIGTHAPTLRVFAIGSDSIISYPMGNFREAIEQAVTLATYPEDWYLRPEHGIVSSDGRWAIIAPTLHGKGSVIAVIDISNRGISHALPVSWTATSISLASDGKRLLVGSSDSAVYEFDFLKMTGQP